MKLIAKLKSWSGESALGIDLYDGRSNVLVGVTSIGTLDQHTEGGIELHQMITRRVVDLINRPDPEPDKGMAVAKLVAGVGDTAEEAMLSVDVSCKAAAGDELAAQCMILLDRIGGTRAANRDVVLVEHDTLLRLIRAAGYGGKQ